MYFRGSLFDRALPTELMALSLNTHLSFNAILWCRQEDLNPQPTDYKSVALPVELHRHYKGAFTTVIIH